MARDGSGNYTLPEAAFVPDTVANATAVNSDFSDIASALTASIAKDGQTTPTADLPMGGYNHTGLGAASAAADSLSLGQAQAEAFIWCGTAGGTADAITLSPSPSITAYAAGQRFVWIAGASPNTGAATVAVSGLATKALQNDGSALAAGDHAAGKMYMGIYDGTQFQILRFSFTNILTGDNTLSGDNTFSGSNTFSGVTSFTAQQRLAKGADVASATALALGTDGNYFDITGTTAITSIDTLGVGTVVRLHFDGALTLTHHATDLIMPGGVSITTAAGDEAEFVEYASGDWRCTSYTRALQQPGQHVVQVVNTQTGAMSTGTTALPVDDTIPQKTEGDEFMTLAITPKSTSNILVIEAILNITVNNSGSTVIAAALFQDSTAGALAVSAADHGSTNDLVNLKLLYKMAAGTTSSTTFKVRAGCPSGTVTFNGSGGARLFGGAFASSITITEYAA